MIAPSTPINLVASHTTGDSTTLNWEAATDESGIWGYVILKDGVELGRTASTNYRVTGLSASTSYTFMVKAYDNYSNLSSVSNMATVTTTTLAKPCSVASGYVAYFNIGKVKFNTLEHRSTVEIGYEDFAYLNTEVEIGQVYNLEITPYTALGYGQFPLAYHVYLDTNNSGTFNPSKKIATLTGKVGAVTTPITIPASTVLDQPVRLRIIQIYNNSNQTITGCDTFTFGQVEDYSITAKRTLAIGELDAKEIKIYPNPVKDILNVELFDPSEFNYQITNPIGSVLKNGKLSGKIEVSNLKEGLYLITIQQNGIEFVHKFINQ